LNGSPAKTAEIYSHKEVPFRFRGRAFRFALSQGLFSSADIDRGTGLLLKVLSQTWDMDRAGGKPLPRRILDCGCGCGIAGICAAALALPFAPEIRVRAQDRDELARLFTAHNALANGIPPEVLEAHTEPLLAGPPHSRWDLILSNIPAKTGKPVLEDFVARSLGLLEPGGKVLLAAVNELEDFFRSRISAAGGEIFREEAGTGHIIFGYSQGKAREAGPVQRGNDFLESNPFYLRHHLDGGFAGIPLSMDTIHGAPGFDQPGGAAEAAAKLARRLGLAARVNSGGPILFHEPGQGWFPAWFRVLQEAAGTGENFDRPPLRVLSGRNILALEAARRNVQAAGNGKTSPEILLLPAADLSHCGDIARKAAGAEAAEESAGPFGFIAAFPEAVPRVDGSSLCWEGFTGLLAAGGIALASLPSPEAERLDRKKPSLFTRLGDLRRKGFRALAYRKQ
jgi:hypothetical protein